ncbi:hypothetical protein [Dysgonomonas sp. HGC4]|uniref:hypothetical protein n=1 Tax=Dysgonomonas sp. HGC4 TaxID=1658009 RepID=UPI00068035CF|nr:hypothetical protein [Dysgonomonas sp. HGC4]MBD8349696.1 hypothetical protein [Dysgonomonas sp. HGC4]
MKKLFILLFVATSFILTSCGDTKKAEKTETESAEKVSTEDSGQSSDKEALAVLVKFEEQLDKMAPFVEKAKAGDKDAIAERTRIGLEITTFLREEGTIMYKLSDADTKKYQELGDKFISFVE